MEIKKDRVITPVLCKLVTGEEIMFEVLAVDDSQFTVLNPSHIMQTKDGFDLAPFLPLIDLGKNGERVLEIDTSRMLVVPQVPVEAAIRLYKIYFQDGFAESEVVSEKARLEAAKPSPIIGAEPKSIIIPPTSSQFSKDK